MDLLTHSGEPEFCLRTESLLTRLVDDLRTLALADAGQLSLDLQPVDLIAIAQGSIEQFTPQAEARQVKLQFDSPGHCRQSSQIQPGLGRY